MLNVFQRNQEELPTLRTYGKQISRIIEHRCALETLTAARQELERSTEMSRAAMLAAGRANRTKTEFLANMSHELRTPLNAIIGFSEIIEREILGQAQGNLKYVDYARDINGAGKHLLNVINDILDIAKIEAGQLELEEVVFDVNDSLCICLKMLAELSQKDAVQLERTGLDSLPSLRGDEKKFKQIVINLLSNAIKFTPEGGQVSLGAEIDAHGDLKVTISDTGMGSGSPLKTLTRPWLRSRKWTPPFLASTRAPASGCPSVKRLPSCTAAASPWRPNRASGPRSPYSFPAERIERSPRDLKTLSTADETVG